MSELRSVIEALGAEVLTELPDATIEQDFAELHVAGELLELQRLRRLREIERRGTFGRDGHLSIAAWLADTFRLSWGAARASVRTAKALEQMPVTSQAVSSAALSLCGARVLPAAQQTNATVF